MSEPITTYLADLARYHADPHSSEMSYRTAFQNYLTSIFPQAEKYHIQHDPKAIKGNKPDFIILKHGVPLLYIEVKKFGEDLDVALLLAEEQNQHLSGQNKQENWAKQPLPLSVLIGKAHSESDIDKIRKVSRI